MAPKRQQKRNPRRINVRFMKKGEDEYAVGYTKNVSAGGLFIGTIRPLPPGTEIVVDIKEGERLRQRPAVVVHAARVSPLLASVQTSGMGVRFLDGEQTEKAVTTVQVEAEKSPVESMEEVAQLPGEDDGEPDIEVDLTVVESFREAFRRDIQHGLIFVLGPILRTGFSQAACSRMSLKSVVLPEPLAPSRPTRLPNERCRSALSKSVRSPKAFE